MCIVQQINGRFNSGKGDEIVKFLKILLLQSYCYTTTATATLLQSSCVSESVSVQLWLLSWNFFKMEIGLHK